MTKKQNTYTTQQLQNIQNKTNEDDLRRYEALLSGAKLDKEVHERLTRACGMKRKELNPVSPMVENGDMSDFN